MSAFLSGENRLSQPSTKIEIRSEQYIDYNSLQEQNLECSICLSIITGTVAVTLCLHKFCSRCLFEYLKTKRDNGSCPNCRTSITIDDVILSDDFTDLLNKTMIKCKNIGCNVQINRKEYADHISTHCDYIKKQCKQCNTYLLQKNYKKHTEIDCDYRLEKCNWCGYFIKHLEMGIHKENCSYIPKKCLYEGCDVLSTAYMLSHHMSYCKYKTVQCYNSCGKTIKSCEMQTHISQECTNRVTYCSKCSLAMQYNEINNHECKTCDVEIFKNLTFDYILENPECTHDELIKLLKRDLIKLYKISQLKKILQMFGVKNLSSKKKNELIDILKNIINRDDSSSSK